MTSQAAGEVATVDSPPAAGQTVEHAGTRYSTIKEGLAHILIPPNAKTITDPKATRLENSEKAQNVFYNPIQQFNRDLSVLAIRAFSEDFAERRKQRAEKKSEGALKKRERKQARLAAQSASKETESHAPSTTTNGEHPDEANAVAETKKRKADDDSIEPDSVVSKKPKVDPTTTNDDTPIEETSAEPLDAPINASIAEPADPEVASKAPNGHRPDDKLRTTMRILDALSATGLRALRYASELPIPVSVVANDLLPTATAAIKLNVQHNRLTPKIQATTSNAQAHMYNAAFGFSSHAYAKYDVIDLDPYGTAVPFIDAALHALNDNGLLCVTCTDAGVFNSMGYLEKTYALYGGIPVKGLHAHEAGLRLILNSIATAAGKHGLSIEPLLSLSIDFYARVFVRVRRSPNDVKFLASKTISVHSCDAGCGAWSIQPLSRSSLAQGIKGVPFHKYHPSQTSSDRTCAHCGSRTHLAGPMWGGPLHNPEFISRILSYLPSLDKSTYATTERIEGMLTTALDELLVLPSTAAPPSSVDGLLPPVPAAATDPHPFSFSISALSRILRCQAPPEAAIRGALRHMGYVATRSHAKPGMVKTDAPWEVVWDVMRAWVAAHPIKEGALGEGASGFRILYGKKEGDEGEKREIVFDEELGREKRGKRIVRYQMNPRDNWGPMSRAKG